MRGKLVSQLLSKSVEEALLFCKLLKLQDFQDVAPTVNCTKTFNDLFHILNFRKLNQTHQKNHLTEKNGVCLIFNLH